MRAASASTIRLGARPSQATGCAAVERDEPGGAALAVPAEGIAGAGRERVRGVGDFELVPRGQAGHERSRPADTQACRARRRLGKARARKELGERAHAVRAGARAAREHHAAPEHEVRLEGREVLGGERLLRRQHPGRERARGNLGQASVGVALDRAPERGAAGAPRLELGVLGAVGAPVAHELDDQQRPLRQGRNALARAARRRVVHHTERRTGEHEQDRPQTSAIDLDCRP